MLRQAAPQPRLVCITACKTAQNSRSADWNHPLNLYRPSRVTWSSSPSQNHREQRRSG
jgi:hypothetical protein